MSRIHKAGSIWVDPQKPVLIQWENRTAKDTAAVTAAAVKPAFDQENARTAARLLMEEARRKARDIIKNASWEASQMIAEAKQNTGAIAGEARRQGYDDGYKEGMEIGRREYEKACQNALDAVNTLKAEWNGFINSMEAEFVDLVISTAEKVLKYEIDRSENACINMIRSVLSDIKSKDSITVRVHPDNYSGLCGLTENPPPGREWMADINIVVDAGMDIGDCLIETGCGMIDAGTAVQMEQISKAFRQLLPSSSGG